MVTRYNNKSRRRRRHPYMWTTKRFDARRIRTSLTLARWSPQMLGWMLKWIRRCIASASEAFGALWHALSSRTETWTYHHQETSVPCVLPVPVPLIGSEYWVPLHRHPPSLYLYCPGNHQQANVGGAYHLPGEERAVGNVKTVTTTWQNTGCRGLVRCLGCLIIAWHCLVGCHSPAPLVDLKGDGENWSAKFWSLWESQRISGIYEATHFWARGRATYSQVQCVECRQCFRRESDRARNKCTTERWKPIVSSEVLYSAPTAAGSTDYQYIDVVPNSTTLQSSPYHQIQNQSLQSCSVFSRQWFLSQCGATVHIKF